MRRTSDWRMTQRRLQIMPVGGREVAATEAQTVIDGMSAARAQHDQLQYSG